MRPHGADHVVGAIDRHRDHGDVGRGRGLLGAQHRIGVHQQQVVAEVAEEARHQTSDLAVPSDDRHRARVIASGHLRPQRRLMIAT